MKRQPSLGSCLAGMAAVALTAGLATRPWTIRPIESATGDTPAVTDRFDAAAYVESIWTTRVVAAAKASAVELGPTGAVTPATTGAVLVRGTGTVTRVDTRSRVGLAFVDLAPGDGLPDVAIQVGPVLRGTAVRDALPSIRFGDFANQLDYADVANALNARVLRSVLGGPLAPLAEGRRVSFWGAMKPGPTTPDHPPEVVPIVLEEGAS